MTDGGDTLVKEGILFVLSGPSGVGKGTVGRRLRERYPNLTYSVSVTSRPPRPGEVEGINYFFRTRQEFETMIKEDAFLEWAEYVSNYYGTPKKFVFDELKKGRDVLLEIEVQGALQVRERYPQGIFIFLIPPTMTALSERLSSRGTEDKETMRKRLYQAFHEIEQMRHYDYVVVNDDIDEAAKRLESIIIAEHHKAKRLVDHYMTRLKEEVDHEISTDR
ncbi:MAG: guanylate kinase [Candidatus Carbobacillus sp.]|nr:guanylate kinase [Candidatus Carbobacillus sp.]